jgi:hypothetical protein
MTFLCHICENTSHCVFPSHYLIITLSFISPGLQERVLVLNPEINKFQYRLVPGLLSLGFSIYGISEGIAGLEPVESYLKSLEKAEFLTKVLSGTPFLASFMKVGGITALRLRNVRKATVDVEVEDEDEREYGGEKLREGNADTMEDEGDNSESEGETTEDDEEAAYEKVGESSTSVPQELSTDGETASRKRRKVDKGKQRA